MYTYIEKHLNPIFTKLTLTKSIVDIQLSIFMPPLIKIQIAYKQ